MNGMLAATAKRSERPNRQRFIDPCTKTDIRLSACPCHEGNVGFCRSPPNRRQFEFLYGADPLHPGPFGRKPNKQSTSILVILGNLPRACRFTLHLVSLNWCLSFSAARTRLFAGGVSSTQQMELAQNANQTASSGSKPSSTAPAFPV